MVFQIGRSKNEPWKNHTEDWGEMLIKSNILSVPSPIQLPQCGRKSGDTLHVEAAIL